MHSTAMRILCACLVISLAFSARINQDAGSMLREASERRELARQSQTSQEAAGKSDKTGSPEALCSDGTAIRHACATLKQEANYNSWTAEPWVTSSQLRDYFIAEPEDIDGLMKAIYPELARQESSWISCKSLCESSLHYLSDEGWTLPDKRGSYCKSRVENSTTCTDWEPIGEQYMTDLAYQMDLTDEIKRRGDESEESEDSDDSVNQYVDDDSETSDSFRYSDAELALRLANIFDVFPTFPAGEAGYSLLEQPPVFGPRVRSSRYSTWYSTMAEAESWANTALAKFSGAEGAVQTWFGRSDATTMRNVRKGLVGMVKTLSMTKIKVGGRPCSPASSTMAFVTSYSNSRTGEWLYGEKEKDDRGRDRYVINVCERYWKPEFIESPASKFGTMVHESSHHQGTTDESFNGAAPYGRAQCLRMASLAPDKALNNADNFKWFIYYMNYCSDAPTSTANTPPCKLELKRNGMSSVKVVAACTQKVQGATMKVVDRRGRYLQKASNYGTFDQGEWVLESNLNVGVGNFVKIFYEYDCAMWEAAGQWRGSDLTAKADKLIDLTEGGTDTGGSGPVITEPEKPIVKPTKPIKPSSPAKLPCELILDTDVRLTGGANGFKVLVSCTSNVRDARLSFQGPSRSSPEYSDRLFGDVTKDSKWKLWTHKIADYEDYTFTFTATYHGSESSISITLDTKQDTPVERRLPCEISIFDDNGWMKLSNGSAGFEIKVRCSSKVRDGVLSFPGTNYKKKRFRDDFDAGATYTLLTLQTSKEVGNRYAFTGTYLGSTSTVTSETVKAPSRTSGSSRKLPCTLTLDDDRGKMRLTSGGRGFQVKLECTDNVSGVTLRFPGTNFTPKRFSTRITPGGAYTLMTLAKSGNIGRKFVVEAEYRGKMGSVSATLRS